MSKLTAAELDRQFDRPLPQPASAISIKGAQAVASLYHWARKAHPRVAPGEILHEIVAEIGLAVEVASPVGMGLQIASFAGLFHNDDEAFDICQSSYEDAIDSQVGCEEALPSDGWRERFETSLMLADRFQSVEGRKIQQDRAAFNAAFSAQTVNLRACLQDCSHEDLERVISQPFMIAMEDGLHDEIPKLLSFFVVMATTADGPDDFDGQQPIEF